MLCCVVLCCVVLCCVVLCCVVLCCVVLCCVVSFGLYSFHKERLLYYQCILCEPPPTDAVLLYNPVYLVQIYTGLSH